MADALESLAIKNMDLFENADRSLLDFSRFSFPGMRVNWHHQVVCEHLDRLIRRDIKRLMIFMPPRHSKTELAARRMPAFKLGLNPNSQFMYCTYSADLAAKTSREVQRIIADPFYQARFPETQLRSTSTDKNVKAAQSADMFEIVKAHGYLRAASVGGAITGMGFDCLPGSVLVETSLGPIRIDNVHALVGKGYKINALSLNHARSAYEWRPILASRQLKSDKPIIRIRSDRGSIECTADHRIYVDGSYRKAGDLRCGEGLAKVQQACLHSMRRALLQEVDSVPGVLSRRTSEDGRPDVRLVQQVIPEDSLRGGEGQEKRVHRSILRQVMLRCAPISRDDAPMRMWPTDEDTQGAALSGVHRCAQSIAAKTAHVMWTMCRAVQVQQSQTKILLQSLRLRCAHWAKQSEIFGWSILYRAFPPCEAAGQGAGWDEVCGLWRSSCDQTDPVRSSNQYDRAPHRRGHPEQQLRESGNALPFLPHDPPQIETVAISMVERLCPSDDFVYDIQVAGNENFFANGFLVHNCGIIDDPFKDHAAAYSERQREAVWDWWTSAFITRAEMDATICVMQTRWHEDDLAGRLLLAEPGIWTVLSLPAINEGGPTLLDPRKAGQALWPGKKNETELKAIRALSERDWRALWQQDPRQESGNIVKRHWWKWYDKLPDTFDETLISVDAAFKDTTKSDYVVVQYWGRNKVDKYLIDQFRDKMGIVETMAAIKSMRAKHSQSRKVLIEDKANGPAIIEMLKKKMTGIIPFEPEGSKESRVHSVSPQIESGNVHLPRGASWVEDYVNEFSKFPLAKHDDQVDSTSQALIYLSRHESKGFRALAEW